MQQNQIIEVMSMATALYALPIGDEEAYQPSPSLQRRGISDEPNCYYPGFGGGSGVRSILVNMESYD